MSVGEILCLRYDEEKKTKTRKSRNDKHAKIEMNDICFAERALLQYIFTSSLCLEAWFGFLKTFLWMDHFSVTFTQSL